MKPSKLGRRSHAALLAFLGLLGLCSMLSSSWAASTTVVISQVYGGGGNAGANYKNDFIELHNISNSPVVVTGWSVQYGAATGTTWQVTPLGAGAISIPAGGYWLVQEAAGAAGTTNLPTPDTTGSINMSGTAGKVALVSNTTALSGNATTGSGIVDFVGFGTTANAFEGAGPTPAPSNTAAVARGNNGSTDTDNNNSDFAAGAPTPRNSGTTPYIPPTSPTQVLVETAADGSGAVVPSQSLASGVSITVYAVGRNASNAYSANLAATWSLTNVTGGVVSGDLVPAGDNKSATFTAHGVGTAVIHAVVSGLTSVDSGTISTQAAQMNPSGTGVATPSSVAAGNNTVLSVNVVPGTAGATGIVVTADLTSIGGSAAQTFTNTSGTLYTYQATIPANLAGGSKSIPVTIVDSASNTGSTTISLNVLGAITVLHMNDMHARITPHYWEIPSHDSSIAPQFELVGGAPCFASKMIELKTSYPDALVLDAGDISEGNPLGDMNGNGAMVQFYQALDTKLKSLGGRGIDAMVVGNHDVRFKSYIDNLKNQTNFPVISINICAKGTQTPYFQPYVTVTVNGVKIGILGYTTGSTQVGPDLASTLDLVPCDWNGTASGTIHVATYVNQLRNVQHCDLVFLLTHAGHTELCAGTPPIIADTADAKVPEVAVTGHWHTYCDTVWQPSILNYKTTFTESGSYVHYLGELHVKGDGTYVSCTQHPIRNSEIAPDPDITNLITSLETQYAATNPQYGLNQVIGYSAQDLVLDKRMKWWTGDEYPWDGDNTAGQWICDGAQWKAAQLFGQCDLSIESGGGVRSDIPRGPVTYSQIYETYPWNDDVIYMVKMTGQQIYDYFLGHNCDVAFSKGWFVTVHNGAPALITYNGQAIGLSTVYNVAISNYMYANDTVPFTDPAPHTSSYLQRTALIEYTAQFPATNPLQIGGPRYSFDTEFSGGYYAVVTMMNDADSQTQFDDAFIRLLSATPETMLRYGGIDVPSDLVNADGTINRANRLSEEQMYRSFLGFKTGALKPGDIILTYGKASSFGGNPEFVDQEGVYGNGQEFNIVGHDASLSQPNYAPSIASFWDDMHTNRYVKFFAKKTGASSVTDQNGMTISVSDVTAYSAKSLPGSTGDLLQLTGVPTSEHFGLRFRCDSAVLASSVGVTSFAPNSSVNAVSPSAQTGAPLVLTATATASSVGANVVNLSSVGDSQISLGSPNANSGTKTFLFVQSSSTDSFKDERSWLKFDLSSIPVGTSITTARLHLYCWKAVGASLPVAVYGGSDDSWTETGITWNTQPGFGSALDTQTLATGATNTSYVWDVTSFVQSKRSGDNLASLVVKAVTEGAPDPTAPSYAFESRDYTSNTPYLEVITPGSGSTVTVASVQYFYRYSTDGQTWGSWTADQTATTAPWTVNFTYPSGYGYYQFYSVATDSAGAVEPAPAFADAAVHFVPSALPVVTVAAANPSASEVGAVAGVFAISRTGDTSAALQVFYSINGTALNGQDYSTIAGSATIPAGQAFVNLPIAPIADAMLEGDRTVTLALLPANTYTVGSPSTDFVTLRELNVAGWMQTKFTASQLLDPSVSGPMGNPANDGLSNLLKYALNLDPNTPNAAGAPTLSVINGALALTYTVVKGATDITYTAEVSTDLSQWNSGAGYTSVYSTVDGGLTETVTVVSSLPVGVGPQFMHLRVSQP